MKKAIIFVACVGLIIGTSGVSLAAIDLQPGGLYFKTLAWSVGTGYSGTPGKTYFANANVPGYNPQNPDHLLFNDPSLTIIRPEDKKFMEGEDGWGLIKLIDIWDGVPNATNTDINKDEMYWVTGDNDSYLQGMYWGVQDQRVEVLDVDVMRIYSTGLQFNLYEVAVDGGVGTDYDPGDRVAMDTFGAWVDGSGTLQAKGEGVWERFIGDADASGVDGQTLVYLNVNEGAWNDVLDPFWQITQSDKDGLFDTSELADLYQTWSIIGTNQERWTNGEDAGRGYVIPEPATICLLSIGALALVRRKRS